MALDPEPRRPHARRLYLVPHDASHGASALPTVVPLLRPDEPVTPAQDALVTAIARQARLGDRDARDLLWRAFAARLQPAMLRGGRVAWQAGWSRRNGRPWELDDVQQEAWLVFADLTACWNGEGSFVPYMTAYFPWRLRNALRRLGPPRQHALPLRVAASVCAPRVDLTGAEESAVLAALVAALSPGDAEILRQWAAGDDLTGIARRLGVARRTVQRRWARIRRVARIVLRECGASAPGAPAGADGTGQ